MRSRTSSTTPSARGTWGSPPLSGRSRTTGATRSSELLPAPAPKRRRPHPPRRSNPRRGKRPPASAHPISAFRAAARGTARSCSAPTASGATREGDQGSARATADPADPLRASPAEGAGLPSGLERAPVLQHGQTETEVEWLADRHEALARVETASAQLTDWDEQAHGLIATRMRCASRVRQQLNGDARPPICRRDEQVAEVREGRVRHRLKGVARGRDERGVPDERTL